ncbi:MAG: hypothetical protein KF803_05860 [Cyclobacteriaceae bacterium]|nr:hypothetical protein [Cyclobacteriaceae bacterium]
MKSILILTFSVLSATVACSQQVSDLPANSFPFNLSGNTIQTFDNRYEGVRGHYTFFEDFSPGVVELKNKEVYQNVLINYDAVSDNLIAKSERTSSNMVVRKDLVQKFVLRDGSREFRFVKQSVNGLATFLLELVEGETAFYCKVSKSIRRAELGGAYNTSESRYDEFKSSLIYYIKDLKGFREIPQTKKGIIRSFPSLENKLSTFFKKNKVDFNDYYEVQFLFEYIAENL